MRRIRRYLSRTLEAGPQATLQILRARLSGYLLWPYCAFEKALSNSSSRHSAVIRALGKAYSFLLFTVTGVPFAAKVAPVELQFMSVFSERYGAGDSVERADNFMRGEVEILGVGLLDCGYLPCWNRDFISGFAWDGKFHKQVDYVRLNVRCDVKVPWELSRLHCLTWLAQAWRSTGKKEYVDSIFLVLRDWRLKNSFGYGVNWTCSMEVAIRALNVFCCFSLVRGAASEEFNILVADTLFEHYLHMDFNLEISDVNGNHLLFDRLGLAVVACEIFGKDSAPAVRHVRELCEEIGDQFQSDGVHLENATGYQRLIVEAVLFFVAYCKERGIQLPERCLRVVGLSVAFLQAVRSHDGVIPLFGDSDSGNVFQMSGDFGNSAGRLQQFLSDFTNKDVFQESPATVSADQDAKKIGLIPFFEGGYYVMRSRAFFACIKSGKSGLRGRGSHDHNDQLSFFLEVFDLPLFIDPGTHNYTRDIDRHVLDLTTRRHNTVMIQREEQRPILIGSTTYTVRSSGGECSRFCCEGEAAVFEGRVIQSANSFHNGVHTRKISATVNSDLECRFLIEDRVNCEAKSGRFSCEATFFVPFGWSIVNSKEEGRTSLSKDAVLVEMESSGSAGTPVIDEEEYSPDYGKVCRGYAIRFPFDGADSAVLTTNIICRSRDLSVRATPLTS
jgi:hypothetical protein